MKDVAGNLSFSGSGVGYSYAAVAVAILVGLFVPRAAATLLGPVLLLGLVGLGLAHGACDQLVLPAYHRVGGWWRYLLRFVVGYLGLALTVVFLWWHWPGATVGFFFLLTVWHWGSADAPAVPHQQGLWLIHSLLRGTLLFAVPALAWPHPTLGIINGLLTFAGATPLASVRFHAIASGLWPVVLGGHVGLWGYYAALPGPWRWPRDVLEVALLTALFGVLPPLLSLGVYFSYWHGLQHVLRLNRVLGYPAASQQPRGVGLVRELLVFGRRALPLLLVSVGALTGLYTLLPPRLVSSSNAISFALVVASVVTLPHALLVSVVMDARKWKPVP